MGVIEQGSALTSSITTNVLTIRDDKQYCLFYHNRPCYVMATLWHSMIAIATTLNLRSLFPDAITQC